MFGGVLHHAVVGGCLDNCAARLFGHAHYIKAGLGLHNAAPSLEFSYKQIEVLYIVCGLLNVNLLTALKFGVHLIGIAHAEYSDILALRLGDNAQSLH